MTQASNDRLLSAPEPLITPKAEGGRRKTLAKLNSFDPYFGAQQSNDLKKVKEVLKQDMKTGGAMTSILALNENPINGSLGRKRLQIFENITLTKSNKKKSKKKNSTKQ